MFAIVFYFIVIMTASHLYADAPVNPGFPFPKPTAEELAQIEEFLSTLSEEELAELAQIGEEIMREAEKSGVNLEDFLTPEKTVAAPIAQTVTPKEVKAPAKVFTASTKDTHDLSKILDDLISHIDSITQKTSIDQKLEEAVTPLYEQLSLLHYYIHVINDDSILPFLLEKENISLLNQLKNFEIKLEELDDAFDVDLLHHEYQLKIPSQAHVLKVRKALNKAQTHLSSIMRFFTKTLSQDGLMKNIEDLIKKYEPEALKVKESNKLKEQEAFNYIKKAQGRGAAASTQAPQKGGGAENKDSKPLTIYQGGKQAGSAKIQTTPTKRPSAPSPSSIKSNTSDAKKAKSDNKDKKDVKVSTDELLVQAEAKSKESLAHAEGILLHHAKSITDSLNMESNLTFTQKNGLDEVNFVLKTASNEISEWKKHVLKLAGKDLKIYKDKSNRLTQFFSTGCNNLNKVHSKLEATIAKNKKFTPSPELKKFQSLMDEIKKKIQEF